MISETQPKLYCSEPVENIENYDKAVADNEHLWDCHHRAEVLPCGRYSREALKRVGMYWNRPASELIFLRQDAHRSLHFKGGAGPNKGKTFGLETRRKMAESNPQKKKVEMYRESVGFTKVFPSQKEAARWLRENGYPRAYWGHISDSCHGIRRSAYGAKWRIV